MEGYVQEEVSQFLLEFFQVVVVNSLNDFVCFFYQALPDRLMCLLPVPRAFAPKPAHDLHEFFEELVLGFGFHGGMRRIIEKSSGRIKFPAS
jgi:hypothetical protein